ncbi:MAG: amidohydrolase family protein [Anaerolineae bacterium]
MRIDIHVHAMEQDISQETMLAGLAEAGLDKAVILSPPPDWDARDHELSMRDSADWLAGAVRGAEDRLIPFVWIEPDRPDAVEALDHAILELGFRGVKMIPNHWYPYEERLFPVYARIEELGVPLLCHSGILFGHMDGSRFCRPAFYEVFIHFPRLRFALAHIGWPWVDECLAVAGRFRARAHETGLPMQMWVDTTPGTPPLWRTEALQKALAYLGADRLLWGSDSRADNIGEAGGRMASDRELLTRELGGNDQTETAWFGGNAETWLGIAAT